MDECDSLDPEVTELQELQGEASDTISQDDEDEVEELQNSLREIVQDQSVKPKLQCLMVDPSFSMVTVQSEDSGIVWETASSRCSTPWASETSSTSEAYSMDGSGGAGKITIVFDEEKVVRRRKRSGGRSSRLGDRLSRPGSSRSASALGVERPEMAEVSLPNVKEEKTKTEVELEEIKTKDQQLFSLISEGYEILNIRVPSKLPTVDEEESTELQDNLSYLDQTPKIRSRNHHTWAQRKDHDMPEEIPDHTEPSKPDSSQSPADSELRQTPAPKESTSDIDYFEKFTLLDVTVPGEQESEPQEEPAQPAENPQTEEQRPVKEVPTDSSSVSEDSFVFVTDVDIVGEHLDEVFYGEGPPAGMLQQRGRDKDVSRTRGRRESQRSMQGSGSVLFESEETTLTPIFISAGPPKIIDPILLEEPKAMSFMYSDLYEDAVGERRRSDEECSEAESVVSEKSYQRRFSDSEEADGYLEKFILKDETPTVDVQSDSVEDEKGGRMMWPQNKFEMTGCLIKVSEDEEKTQMEKPKLQEASTSEDLCSEIIKEEKEIETKTVDREDVQISIVAQDEVTPKAPKDLTREPEPMEEQMEHQQVQHEVKMDQNEPPVPSTEKMHVTHQVDIKETEETEACPREDEKIRGQSSIDKEQKVTEKMTEVLATDNTTLTMPDSSQVPPADTEPVLQTENTETSLPEQAAVDSKIVEAQVKDAESVTLSLTEPLIEMETSADKSLCEGKETSQVPEDAAPAEVITDCQVKETTKVPEDAAPAEVITDCQGKETEKVSEDAAPAEVITDCEVKETAKVPEVAAPAEVITDCQVKETTKVPEDAAPAEVITDCQVKETTKVPEDAAPAEVITDCEVKETTKVPEVAAPAEVITDCEVKETTKVPEDAAPAEVITDCQVKETAKVPEDAAPAEVITDCQVKETTKVPEDAAPAEVITDCEVNETTKVPEVAAPAEVITDCEVNETTKVPEVAAPVEVITECEVKEIAKVPEDAAPAEVITDSEVKEIAKVPEDAAPAEVITDCQVKETTKVPEVAAPAEVITDCQVKETTKVPEVAAPAEVITDCQVKETAKVPEDAAPAEVITDCEVKETTKVPEDAAPAEVITDCQVKETAKVPEDAAPAEVITDCQVKETTKVPEVAAPAEVITDCQVKETTKVPEDAAPAEVITDCEVNETTKVPEVAAPAEVITDCEVNETTKVPEVAAPVEVITECEVKEIAKVPEDAAPAEVITDSEVKEIAKVPEDAAPAEVITDCQVKETTKVPEVAAPAEVITDCQVKETTKVPEVAAPAEVITDCDCTVQTVVEVSEKKMNEKEIQTQVDIDFHQVTSVEAPGVQTASPGGEKELQSLIEETAADITAAGQEREIKTEILREVTKPLIPEDGKKESDEKHHQFHETEQQQQQKTHSESDSTKLIQEVSSKIHEEDTGAGVQDILNVGDEFILLVPKGQAVEMDIDISQLSEKTKEDTKAPPEPDGTCDLQVSELQTEVTPEVVVNEDDLQRNHLDRRKSPPAPLEEADMPDWKTEKDVEEGKVVVSPLRSFTAFEDLSGLSTDDIQAVEADVEEVAEKAKKEDVPEIDATPYTDLHSQDVGQKMEQDEAAVEASELAMDELSYEMISEQDVKDVEESEAKRDVEEFAQRQEKKMEVEAEKDLEVDLSTEEHIEADYEIIDAEEESQARLAAELQGMDWFCVTCACLLSVDEYMSGEHGSHQVDSVDKAYEKIQESLGVWISDLQARSENIEDLVSELELAYNSVEDQYTESEAAMQAQNDEMMALVMEQYNGMSVSMEEEKKAKLEQLYDKIVSFQENIDSAKSSLEATASEAETDARSPEDIHARLKAALDSALSLELGAKGLLVFEDYAKPNVSSSNLTQRKGIPVPQKPTLQCQEPGSATSTSVTVYWKVNPGDIIDCFQVYCVEDPQGDVSEEYRVTVKESYCVLEELEPDKMYKVWVMAVNYTGCSLPSERLVFKTAPSVPLIDTERCTVMWDSATLRWSSTKQTPEQSYTLEYCRQYELEGEGLRSISGIKVCEQKVLLQPNENYLFYIKAVNEAGASDQSEAALISTKGTRFHLLKASAHPTLELSEDQTTLHYSQDAHKTAPADKVCPSILGDMFPSRGFYYWETIVTGSKAYRLGVACSTANRNSSLGESSSSWCLQCAPIPSGCRYQLLHNDVQSSVFVIEEPERVGILLDYQLGCLSFYNAGSGQLLGTFRQRFTSPCHPALALEQPGCLQLCIVQEVPEFTKDS